MKLRAILNETRGTPLLSVRDRAGKLYAQIKNGAPFDVFLSADATRPKLLEEEGFVVPGSRFTYAVGRLTLWHPGSAMIGGNGQSILLSDDVEHVAIANPKTAPYGAAAKEALQATGTLGASSGPGWSVEKISDKPSTLFFRGMLR